MSVHELWMPMMADGTRTAYGGDQGWCHSEMHRRGGCAPTSGTNLAAYYAATRENMHALYQGNLVQFDREEFADNIEEMFRYIKPGFRGFPHAEKFVIKFREFLNSRGFDMTGTLIGERESAEQMYDFVRGSIDAGHPLAILVLGHRAPEMEDDNWHWMTMTGYTEGADGRAVILSNCGDREVRDADMLFERHEDNYVRLLHFDDILS